MSGLFDRVTRAQFAGPYSARGLVGGLRDAVFSPLRADARGVKAIRDDYPTADAVLGIHPVVSGMQAANDLAAGAPDAGTAMNAIQMIPNVKGLSGLAGAVIKQRGLPIGNKTYVIDMPSTIRRNAYLTGGQILGQPAHAE